MSNLNAIQLDWDVVGLLKCFITIFPESTHNENKGLDKPLDVLKSAVSQNVSSSALDKTLVLPTQPELSHVRISVHKLIILLNAYSECFSIFILMFKDVFVPTPSLESGNSSQGQDPQKRKEAPKENPSTSIDAGGFKKPTESQPIDVTTSFQLELDSQNSVFDKKTQVFTVNDDSQATQIEEGEESVVMNEKDSDAVCKSAKSNGSGSDPGFITSDLSREILLSRESALKPEQADDECSSQKISSPSTNVTEPVSKSQESLCVSNDVTSHMEGVIDLTSSSSQNREPGTASQSVIFPAQVGDENDCVTEPKLTQPMSQGHRLDSISNTTEKNSKEDHLAGVDEIQSTSKTESSGLGLALSQTQTASSEPMEIEEGPAESENEESFGVMVLEESQRVSQEKAQRSQALKSSSQPVKSSPKENAENKRKLIGSQPSISGAQVPKNGSQQNPEACDEGNLANKSLSDSSGGRTIETCV